MKLSLLCILLGLGVSLFSIPGLIKPKSFTQIIRQFPRSLVAGYILVALATAWFLYYLKLESISDFAAYKPTMLMGFAVLGGMTCVFVTDFLAIRGLAILFMLLAKLMVDTAHLADSSWRLVIVTWAYLLVFAGMWFTISPWRMRDFIHWTTASETRLRIISLVRLAFGLLVLGLGIFVF